MNNFQVSAEDNYIGRLKKARDSIAVLKYKLALLRSGSPKVTVFVFEGGDDKVIYYCWIRRIVPNIIYEPFPCNGKRQVLEFREMLRRDLGGLQQGVYYFIDRDFDDLAGFDPDENTFMTDRYAVENYLVCEEVLEEVLKNEFHCHANPEARKVIIDLFRRVYDQFLCAVAPINERLFLAKMEKIPLVGYPPKKINKFIEVRLDEVISKGHSPEALVTFSRHPTRSEVRRARVAFRKLEPRSRYRGKYALEFFLKWLALLAESYTNSSSCIFKGVPKTEKVRQSELVSSGLAIKSPLPQGLADFIARVASGPSPAAGRGGV